MHAPQIIHESIGLSTISEIGGSSASYAPYYGRGYIQLTNKDNYATASQYGFAFFTNSQTCYVGALLISLLVRQNPT